MQPQVYTPEQVAHLLQLSKNTVYNLIGKGEIIAKRIGKVYRVPASSLSFVFSGLDKDLYEAEQKDIALLPPVLTAIKKVRSRHG